MGKIWIKTKYDNSLKIDIPHNINFANAMYGFRELGATINFYHNLSDIYDIVTRKDTVVDYIDQCNAIFRKFDCEPGLPDYPEVLKPFLGRKIWKDTINSIAADEKKWSAGYFVKPLRDKAFTGKIIHNIGDLVGCGSAYEDYDVWVSEPIEMTAEWRCFILYDRLLDVRPYGLIANDDYDGYLYHYNSKVLMNIMDAFRHWDKRPAACSIDICSTKDGRTLVVEMNNAYSLGCYGLSGIFYAKMISARWSQILDRKDEFDFRMLNRL